jgi:hypothetical protein
MPIEPQIPGFLTGTIVATVTDPAGVVPQTNIIQIADPWTVRVQWSITGGIVSVIDDKATWRLRVYLESLGPGLEALVGSADVQVDTVPLMPLPAPGTRSYDRIIPVPGNFPGLQPGAHKLVTVLTIDKSGVPGMIAGFVEGQVLQFYQFP